MQLETPVTPPKHRVVVFGSPTLRKTYILVDAFLRAAQARQDVEVVAICDSDRVPPFPRPLFAIDARCRHLLAWPFNPSLRTKRVPPIVRNIYSISSDYGIPIIVPAQRDINHPSFALQLRQWRATMALCLGCEQIFSTSLLNMFERAVNCHSSYLPDYRGVASTEWSLYHGEKCTGYTFHLMDANIDTGPMLIQSTIPVTPEMTLGEVDQTKWLRAARDAGAVLDMMLGGQTGTVQTGRGRAFWFADLRRIRRIDNVGEITAEDLVRRLRSFGAIDITIGGKVYPVTAVRRPRSSSSRFLLVTKDGQRFVPYRFQQFPLPVFRIVSKLTQPLWRFKVDRYATARTAG